MNPGLMGVIQHHKECFSSAADAGNELEATIYRASLSGIVTAMAYLPCESGAFAAAREVQQEMEARYRHEFLD